MKVAGYCRVSTDREDQANSFRSQQQYFREYIASHPDWELHEIYADEGITGTSTKKRTQFNRMIQDAYLGRFQLIITKEVSRFSRNLLDTITYTRELKSLGIGVIFMNDGLYSLDPDAELRLSIMGSIAQEESRKTSARVKWGQTRQMERGVVFGTSLLGYDLRNGQLTVNPEGAEIVRLIFHKYAVEKKGTSTISRELAATGYKTFHHNTVWSSSQIVKILRNEKYAGDLVQKKTITPDYLTHEKKPNRGEEEFVIIKNHHEPIIDRELWEKVQKELQNRNRSRKSTGHSNRYVFSGKIICGECGSCFVSRKKIRKSGSTYLRWACYTASTQGTKSVDWGTGCQIGKILRDELLMDALTMAIKSIPMDFEWMIRNLSRLITTAINDSQSSDAQKLQKQIAQINKKREALLDAFAEGVISREDLVRMKSVYEEKCSLLNEKLLAFSNKNTPTQEQSRAAIKQRIRSVVTCAHSSVPLYKMLLNKVVIQMDGSFQLYLKDIPLIWCFQIQYHNRPPKPGTVDPENNMKLAP